MGVFSTDFACPLHCEAELERVQAELWKRVVRLMASTLWQYCLRYFLEVAGCYHEFPLVL